MNQGYLPGIAIDTTQPIPNNRAQRPTIEPTASLFGSIIKINRGVANRYAPTTNHLGPYISVYLPAIGAKREGTTIARNINPAPIELKWNTSTVLSGRVVSNAVNMELRAIVMNMALS